MLASGKIVSGQLNQKNIVSMLMSLNQFKHLEKIFKQFWFFSCTDHSRLKFAIPV